MVMKPSSRIALLTAALLFAACDDTVVRIVEPEDTGADGDSDSDTDSDSDADTDPHTDTITATVVTLNSFEGDPSCLSSRFFAEVPPHGDAAGTGASYFDPVFAPTDPPYFEYSYWTSQSSLDGAYYLVVLLFFSADGDCRDDPVPGVDFIGWSSNPLVLGSNHKAPLDAGAIFLQPVPGN